MEESLKQARALVLKYRELVEARDIDTMLQALSDDATLQLPDTPLLEHKAGIRQFYEDRYAAGDYRFQIEITDEKAVSDLFFINGHMTRTLTREGAADESTVLNFSFILKKENGILKIWQMRVV